jgi:hypothetical protein
MLETNFLFRLKEPLVLLVFVRAAKTEVCGEHLVFLRSSGELCALFLFEQVERVITITAEHRGDLEPTGTKRKEDEREP